jgi:hypothetical protein
MLRNDEKICKSLVCKRRIFSVENFGKRFFGSFGSFNLILISKISQPGRGEKTTKKIMGKLVKNKKFLAHNGNYKLAENYPSTFDFHCGLQAIITMESELDLSVNSPEMYGKLKPIRPNPNWRLLTFK